MSDITAQADLIAEALVREIGRRGQRWSGIVAAWEALVIVRHVSDAMQKEAAHLQGWTVQLGAASTVPNAPAPAAAPRTE